MISNYSIFHKIFRAIQSRQVSPILLKNKAPHCSKRIKRRHSNDASSNNIKVSLFQKEKDARENKMNQSISSESCDSLIQKMARFSKEIQLENKHTINLQDAVVNLNELAHSIKPCNLDKEGLKERGDIAWSICKRLLQEEGIYNVETDCISSNSIERSKVINHAVVHSAIKCMAQSRSEELFRKAYDMIQKLGEYYLGTQSQHMRPTGRSYALLLNSMSSLPTNFIRNKDFVSMVEKMHQDIKEQEERGNDLVSFNRYILNAMLNALSSRCDTNKEAVDMIERILKDEMMPLDQSCCNAALKSLFSSQLWIESKVDITANIEELLLYLKGRNFELTQGTMTPLLHYLSKQGRSEKILELLNWMETMYQSNNWKNIRPNRIHFNTMINALVGVEDGGTKALEILDLLKVLHEKGNKDISPDLVTYNAILNCIAKENRMSRTKRNWNTSDIGERAESLLQRMETGKEGNHITPDLISYNCVLTAYMNSNTSDSASRAQHLLEKMIDSDIDPDLLSYTICINTLAKSKLQSSAQKAEDLLRILEKASLDGDSSLTPDVKCYNSVLHAWATSDEKISTKKILQLLKEMKDLREGSGRSDLVPDSVSCTSIISSMTKRGDKESSTLLQEMMSLVERNNVIETDAALQNALLLAHLNSSTSSGLKADKVLRKMVEDSISNPNKIKPNTITFNTVLDAISKSKKNGSALRAEELLQEMQSLHSQGYPNVCPDTLSFASVINAYANSGLYNAAEKAEGILLDMMDMHNSGNKCAAPNTICFATVIKAYSRSKEKGNAQNAERILNMTFEVSEKGDLDAKPNTISFTSVCDAYAKSGQSKAPKKIIELINWMTELKDIGYDCAPNVYTYNTLLTAIARSKDPHKATKAFDLLQRMKDYENVKLNSYSYSIALSACSFTHGPFGVRNEALRTAIIILEDAVKVADSRDRLNIMYGSFFQACANLMKKETEKVKIEKILSAVFQQCCESGYVDQMLLNQVRKASSQQFYLNTFGALDNFPNLTLHSIPTKWHRNVKS